LEDIDMTQTNALAVAQRSAISSPEAWNVMRDQAQVLVKSGFLPNSVKTPEAAIAIMMTGAEFGFEPMQSFRLISVIQGRPTMNASAIAGLVHKFIAQSGDGKFEVAESTDQRCLIEYRRPGEKRENQHLFTIEDAKRAGLTGKENWQKYPKAMLLARAQAGAAREGFPDVVSGIYDPDELAPIETRGHVVESARPTATVTQLPSNDDDWEHANRRIHAVLADRGLTHDHLHNWAASKGYASTRDVPARALNEEARKLEGSAEWAETFGETYARHVDTATGEIIDAQIAPAPVVDTERAHAAKSLWKYASETLGWSKPDLAAVCTFLTPTTLEAATAEDLRNLMLQISTVDKDEANAIRDSAIAAAA